MEVKTFEQKQKRAKKHILRMVVATTGSLRLLRCASKILFIITKQRMSKVNKTRKRAQVDTIRWEPPAGQVVVVGEELGSRSERKTRTVEVVKMVLDLWGKIIMPENQEPKEKYEYVRATRQFT